MPGRYVHKGELLGYVLKGSPSRIKVVVGQDNIGRLQENVHAVNVRFAHAPEKIYSATLTGKAPEPVDRLPSAALATLGGGNIVVDTSSPGELKTLNKLFVVDLQFDARDTEVPLGSRAYVRFDHGKEAVAAQLYRRILQAFMREFNV